MGFTDFLGDLVSTAKDIVPSILGGVTSMATNLPSTALDFALKQFSTSNANENAKSNAREAFDMSQQAYSQRYQTTAKDMRAAGLNPILAATGGFSVGNSPVMAPPQTFKADPTPMPSATTTAKESAEAHSTEAQAKLNMQKITESVNYADKLVQETQLLKDQQLKTWHETKNLIAQLNKIYAETVLTTQRTTESMAHVELMHQQRKEAAALTAQIQANTEKLKQIAEVYKGPLGPALATIHEVTGAIGGAILGGVAGAITGRR